MKWLELAPKPRPVPAGTPILWDVFISYRSANRHWAMTLRDQLAEAGFRVFLDQFVLRPGLPLDESLDESLERSAGGVLVLSKDVASSEWVKNELRKMEALSKSRAGTALRFPLIIAKIDETKAPFSEQGRLFADFSTGYEDGPRGAELLKLACALIEEPVPEVGVRAIFEDDEAVTTVLRKIAARADSSDTDGIFELAKASGDDSPAIAVAAAQALINASRPAAALEILEGPRKRFPRAVRLQQLAGLAFRRLKKTKEAQSVLAELYVAGHRDPETMGIYAATWMERYRESGNRADLERSRVLYLDAFKLSPKDEYVGINAASKSALLGEVTLARELAAKVEALMAAEDGTRFYPSLSLAEARLLLGKYAESEELFRATRERHHHEHIGDLGTTREQIENLISALKIPDEISERLRRALGAA